MTDSRGAKWAPRWHPAMARVGVVLAGCLLAAPAGAQSAKPPAARGQGKAPAAAVVSAQVQGLRGDPVRGLKKSDDERCQECHGADGNGLGHSEGSEGRLPKLAGQPVEYLLKQLDNFRSGARKHDVMSMMARTVTPADLADIAAYFASQPPMKGDGSGDNPVGRGLYERGDAGRGIAACITCHGPGGKGLAGAGAESPRLGGQEWRYLEKQLLDWRSGDRSNSRDGVMNSQIRPLSDEEIRALSSYLSGLP